MMLLFDPDPPYIHWCSFVRDASEKHIQKFIPEWSRDEFDKMKSKKVKAIGCLLYHGGEGITESSKVLTKGYLSKIEDCIHFLPDRNLMTLRIMRYWMRESPEIPHVLFCDTALFAHLPPEASTYAIPYKLHKQGIRRYGGDGLCHQWGLEQIGKLGSKKYKKVISIHLGNQTNIAALKDGNAVETSIGFTPIEGIISSNGCGDIDTSIVLELVFAGMSLEDINRSLSREGGFTGLLGKHCSLTEILQKKNSDDKKFVRELFSYQLIKYIGAFISVLGGVDAIVFVCNYPDKSIELIEKICRSLEFLNLKKRDKVKTSHDHWIFSGDDSEIGVFSFKYDKWNILAKNLTDLITKEL